MMFLSEDNNNNDMEESVTISNAERDQENINTNQKSVNLIDIEGDHTQDNINNISNIPKNTQSIMDNSSANIIDILQGVSLIDDGPKISSAVIPRQVKSNKVLGCITRKPSRICEQEKWFND